MSANLKYFFSILALCSVFFGCATVEHGSTQKIFVVTRPSSNARCVLKNTDGSEWVVASTPGYVNVTRGFSNIMVECTTKSGLKGSFLMEPGHKQYYETFATEPFRVERGNGFGTMLNFMVSSVELVFSFIDTYNRADYNYEKNVVIYLHE